MNAYATGLAPAHSHISPIRRAEAYARAHDFDRPTLILDVDQVADQFHAIRRGLGRAAIHYAVKANPAREVIARLIEEGAHFDAASRAEIELCLSLGARPEQISFGNTVKKSADIAFAWTAGISLFAADAEEELEKIAENAPGAEIFIRLIVSQSEADWPLSRKFGVQPRAAMPLLHRARALGLRPVGFSFHVGSQTRQAAMWRPTVDEFAPLWAEARAAGFDLDLLNIGGGFPAFYNEAIDAPEAYARDVMALVEPRFPGARRIMAEPGRGLVAEAGVIAAEVVLVSRKSPDDLHRWVYLDIGRFSGLAETEGEAIRYQIATDHDGLPAGPCVLAGPSCDSADVLYERRPVELPLALKSGDKVIIRATGAYTTTYSSVGFNGFPPLDMVCI
ncbi:type III PLP-dependent enzyme [Pikeienuella piscinae]|uniref:ornithine decarboxylase n=1 Tax=Pikeienuella piscinae TaxID=2748098 RepID=A0A7M3T6K1_9RHOB|nr:type III PLP-dependent enzyme [Pikeienuella piscinae]QIE57632.1 type III PLP-dependent enzyme [Pikeienuella piscinae]